MIQRVSYQKISNIAQEDNFHIPLKEYGNIFCKIDVTIDVTTKW